MNVEYVNHDGKVLVTNDKGHMVEREYQSDINEILVLENVIEKSEKDLRELCDEVRKCRPNKSKASTISGIITGVYFVFPWIAALIDSLVGETMKYFSTGIGNVPAPLVLSLLMGGTGLAVTVGAYIYDKYVEIKDKQKRISIKTSMGYLEEKKENAEIRLSELKGKKYTEKPNNNENVSSRPIVIHDADRLGEMENYVTVNKLIGNKFGKLYRAYKKGKLDDELRKLDDLANRQMYIDYIEDKGPTLVKNFKLNNKYDRGN